MLLSIPRQAETEDGPNYDYDIRVKQKQNGVDVLCDAETRRMLPDQTRQETRREVEAVCTY